MPVRLTVLALEELQGKPLPLKLSYLEAVWRVGVVLRKKPAWLVVKVDIDRPLARSLAGWLMSYPTRAASLQLSDEPRLLELGVRAGSVGLVVRAELNTLAPKDEDKHPWATRNGARFCRVPW